MHVCCRKLVTVGGCLDSLDWTSGLASVPRRLGVGGEKGETSGRASIESEFGSRRTHRKP